MAYDHHTMFPLGPDDTPYRKISAKGIATTSLNGQSILTVDPAAIANLSSEAFRDINHLLRPAHLRQRMSLNMFVLWIALPLAIKQIVHLIHRRCT